MSYEKERAIYEDKQRDYNVARIARKIQRRVAHKEFVKHTRRFLIVMDVMVVLMVLANFGAVIMTNALVVRATPNMTLMEGNPVQSKINNYVEHPQAKEFMNAAGVTGLILTKLDGTAKGGIVLRISNELKIPVRYIGVGEQIDDLQVFDKESFVKALLED